MSVETTNVTIRIKKDILREAKHLAVDESKSFSSWVSGIISKKVKERKGFEAAKKSALATMERGFKLGGKALSRDEIYSERMKY